jgi:hypothetical protein
MGQLALLYKVNQRFDESEEMYSNILSVKEMYYGEDSDVLV